MSKINKLLWFARRFNTLIPLGMTLLFIGLMIAIAVSILTSPSKPKTTVVATATATNEKIEEDGIIFEFERASDYGRDSTKGSDKFILKLNAKKKSGRSGDYGYRTGTRNLLYINERTGEGTWLFPTQNQIVKFEDVQNDEKGKAIGWIITTQPLPKKDDDEDRYSDQPTTVYFVSADLREKSVAFDKIDSFFAGKKLGNEWSVVYKKDLQLHHAVFSFNTKTVLSDKVVASLETVK